VERDDFGAATSGATLGPLPLDRALAYPYMQVSWISDDFAITRNQDRIERTEDLHFGPAGELRAGWATPNFGADRHALLLHGLFNYGWNLEPDNSVFVGSGIDGRIERGKAVDVRWSGAAMWYFRTTPRTLLRVGATVDAGHALDLDHYYVMGGDTGLRGYPLRYQVGSALVQFNLEERLYTAWSIWELFDVGAAAFFDAGRTWGDNPVSAPQLGWLKDVGLGLRLGNNRSSLGNVIHIDLATPLDAGQGLSRLQFLVSTEATF
jgi:hemolysin activation/secretion protein